MGRSEIVFWTISISTQPTLKEDIFPIDDTPSIVETFVKNEGKITRMEDDLGLSYPTIRNRLHEIIRALGYEPGKETAAPLSDENRRNILEDLNRGEITSDEAMEMLKES